MKPLIVSFVLFSICCQAQNLCVATTTPANSQSTEPCKYYLINVYIHRITDNYIGYTNSVEGVIITNLNSSYNSSGFYFQKSGSREWNSSTFLSPNTPDIAFLSIGDDPGANVQANAINIYVVPSNSNFKAG